MDTTNPVTVPTSSPVSQTPTAGHLDGPVALTKFAWHTFTKGWKTLGMIPVVLLVLYGIAAGLIATESSVGVIIGFVVMIVFYVFMIAAMPATIQAIHRSAIDPGTPMTVKSSYRFGFSVFWSYVLVLIIGGLTVTGSTFLLVIPGIFVIVATVVYKYAFVIDGKKGFSALTESFALVKGRWWKVLGRILFLILVLLIVYLVIIVVSLLLALLPQTVQVIVTAIIGIIIYFIGWTFGHAYFYRLYISLKETRVQGVSTSTFKGWLIGFLCVGILAPLAVIPIMSAIVLSSLNVARMKATDARLQSEARMAEVQRMLDEENQRALEQGTGVPNTQ